jgi:predicted nuclease with TOPRIM domain
MVTNNGFEEQLRKFISEAQDELNRTNEELTSLENKKSILTDDIQSYEHTLRNYLKRIGKEEEEAKSSASWDDILKGLTTHKQRLAAIAEHNNNILRFNMAVNILYNGNYVKSKSRSNAYVQLYNVVNDMVDKGQLKRTRKGMYKLIKPAGRLF